MFRTAWVSEINIPPSRRALVFPVPFKLLISRPFTALDFSELDEDRQRRRATGDISVARHLFEGLRQQTRPNAPRDQRDLVLGLHRIQYAPWALTTSRNVLAIITKSSQMDQ
jgi:hypothetical protein